MRILLVNHFPLEGSGSGVYTMNVARELSEAGHDVRVIYPEHREMEYEWFESRSIIFNNGLADYYDINFNFPCFTSHPRSNETFYNLSEMQIKSYVDAFVEIVKVEVESFKPDIIHAQHLWVAPFAARLSGCPYVVTAHGTDIKGFLRDSRYHKYALEGAKGAGKVITISKQVDREVTDLYGVPDDLRVMISNGYDENMFKIKDVDKAEFMERYGIRGNYGRIVSFAGKLTHFKGVDVLLEAARIYSQGHEKVCTLIAGNGELRDDLLDLKESLGLSDVHFIGHLGQERLVEMYNISDVFVMPSRNEPFGLSALEALACGTPVVATNQGGLPDFINSDVGKLVEANDYNALSDAIIEEMSRGDRDARRSRCASYALEAFSWKNSIGAVEAAYREAIERSNS